MNNNNNYYYMDYNVCNNVLIDFGIINIYP